jgi:hypothetical protein
MRKQAGTLGRRAGSLTAALIAAFILSVGLLLALQAYYHSSVAVARTANRARALMVLESQAETMRAAGFAMLPEPGRHPLPSEALRGLPGATGTLQVRPGPVAGMRLVTLELKWPEEHGPPGRTDLVFAMSAQGMDS